MQALKALVVFMGILIFVAMGFLVYGLLTRVDGGLAETESDGPGAPFGNIESVLPAGASVGGMSVENGRIVVHVRLPGGGAEARIFDLGSGAPLGIIQLRTAP